MATFYNQATLSYNGITKVSNLASGTLNELLTVSKNALEGSYSPGSDVTYSIGIVNTGTVPIENITVTDDLGLYTVGTSTFTPLTFLNGTAQFYINGVLSTTPTVSVGPPLAFNNLTIPAGGNAVIVYEAEANQFAPPNADGSITNTVALISQDLPAAIETTETITPSADPVLSVTKTITPENVNEGDTVTYTITVVNTANTPAEAGDNVLITDNLNPVLTGVTATFNGTLLRTAPDTNPQYTYNETTGVFAIVNNSGTVTVPAATYTQDPVTGAWLVNPGVSTLVITGTL